MDNTEQKLIPLLQEDSMTTFLIEITTEEEHVDHIMDFNIYKVASWTMADEPVDTELYVKGSIKWDGCSHVWFGEEDYETKATDGYLHLYGKGAWKTHCKVMMAVYELAETTITGYDVDCGG